MRTGEVIDTVGRAPSGTEVFVRIQGVAFAIARITVEYQDDGWAVEIEGDTNTTASAR